MYRTGNLLDPEKVVPTTLELGRDYDLMVITGPNTGGKTLTMKTVGIMTLMGQALTSGYVLRASSLE